MNDITKIDNEMVNKFQTLFNVPINQFLKKGIIYGHKNIDKMFEAYEKKEPIYIYTGRGPSNNMHLGHLIPFDFTSYLQKCLDCDVVIQISDDEKYFGNDISMNDIDKYSNNNIEIINKMGFDSDKTFIFKNTEYIGRMYKNICKIQKKISMHRMRKFFGQKETDNIGKFIQPANQIAPCMPSSFDHINENALCVMICAYDQEPYFRLGRKILRSLGFKDPVMIYTDYVPSLLGHGPNLNQYMKMSSSVPNSCIFLNDTVKQIRKKINKSYSGGRDTIEEHREYGGDCEKDIPFRYMSIFCDNEEYIETVRNEYESGRMLSGEIKNLTYMIILRYLERYRD